MMPSLFIFNSNILQEMTCFKIALKILLKRVLVTIRNIINLD